MDFEIDEQALADLCPELRAILDAELAAGGQIARVSRGWFSNDKAIVVDLMGNGFFIETSPLPDGVFFHGADMQSCGMGDYFFCAKHKHTLMASR
jgi:hypothetical protein